MSDTSTEQSTLHNTNSPPEEPVGNSVTEDDEDEEEEDPLAVKQLSLNFEYLMYKINDRVKTLSEQTEEVVVAQNNQYYSDVEKINSDLARIEYLTTDYKRIMDEFVKLEQLSYIVKDFNTRLANIESTMKRI